MPSARTKKEKKKFPSKAFKVGILNNMEENPQKIGFVTLILYSLYCYDVIVNY